MGSQDTSDTSNTKASQEPPSNPAAHYEWAAMQQYVPPQYYPPWGAQHMVPYPVYYGCFPPVASPNSGNDGTTASKTASKGKNSVKRTRTKSQSVGASESERSTEGSEEDKVKDGDKKSQEPATEGVNWECWSSQNGSAAAPGKRGALPTLVPSGPVGSGSAELDERELKRQRRKQSNRESARRSRQRKQKECDELSQSVTMLTQENESLRNELERVQAELKELREENLIFKAQKQQMEAEQVGLEEDKEEEPKLLKLESSSSQEQAASV